MATNISHAWVPRQQEVIDAISPTFRSSNWSLSWAEQFEKHGIPYPKDGDTGFEEAVALLSKQGLPTESNQFSSSKFTAYVLNLKLLQEREKLGITGPLISCQRILDVISSLSLDFLKSNHANQNDRFKMRGYLQKFILVDWSKKEYWHESEYDENLAKKISYLSAYALESINKGLPEEVLQNSAWYGRRFIDAYPSIEVDSDISKAFAKLTQKVFDRCTHNEPSYIFIPASKPSVHSKPLFSIIYNKGPILVQGRIFLTQNKDGATEYCLASPNAKPKTLKGIIEKIEHKESKKLNPIHACT